MRASNLANFLLSCPNNPEVLFEIEENGEVPEASYSVDGVTYQPGFVILRSVD